MKFKCGITPDVISELKPNEIFVFGSNTAGIHGGGAAYYARKHFGAVYGNGEGLQGNSYAIPTKDRNIETLKIEQIKLGASKLASCIIHHPELHFLITKVGCGLAGYIEQDIAPLFKSFLNLPNCSLPIEFIKILET